MNEVFKNALQAHQVGNLQLAHNLYMEVLQRSPDNHMALHYMGVLLYQIGKNEDAIQYIKKSIKLDSRSAAAYNNLGNCYKVARDLESAKIYYEAALRINPNMMDSQNNLGAVLEDMGNIDGAECMYRAVINSSGFNANSKYNLACLLVNKGDYEAAKKLNIELLLEGHEIQIKARVNLGLIFYLTNNFAKCRSIIKEINPEELFNNPKLKIESSYYMLIGKLLNLKTSSVTSNNKIISSIYILGESHALGPNGLDAEFLNKNYRFTSIWIQGCKQWHLKDASSNKFKSYFEKRLSSISKNSYVMFAIGEIDCRANEGIIKFWKKNTDESLPDIVKKTVVDYINYTRNLCWSNKIFPIYIGIPAPVKYGLVTDEDYILVKKVVELMNNYMEMDIGDNGGGFINLFELTKLKDGSSNGIWHIDSNHINPAAIIEAMKRPVMNFNS